LVDGSDSNDFPTTPLLRRSALKVIAELDAPQTRHEPQLPFPGAAPSDSTSTDLAKNAEVKNDSGLTLDQEQILLWQSGLDSGPALAGLPRHPNTNANPPGNVAGGGGPSVGSWLNTSGASTPRQGTRNSSPLMATGTAASSSHAPSGAAFDNGLIGFDPGTGNWTDTRFNGTSYVNEALAHWGLPSNPRAVVVGDLTGSGQDAILTQDQVTAVWTMLSFNGTTYTATNITNWNPQQSYSFVQVADLNGNGRGDIIGKDLRGNWYATEYNGSHFSNVLLGNWSPSVNWQHVMTADLTGTGAQSIIGWNPTTGDWQAIQYNGSGYSNVTLGNRSPGVNWQYVMAANLTGSGARAIVGWNPTTGDWQALQYNGSAYGTVTLGNWDPGINWQNVLVAGIQGNGSDAIVARDPTGGGWYAITYNGTGFTNQQIGSWSPANTYSNLLTGDFFCDGATDVIGMDNTGSWWVLEYGKGSISPGGWSPAINWQNVMVGKINSTGGVAIIGQNPLTGDWVSTQFDGTVYSTQRFATWTVPGTFTNVGVADITGTGQDAIIGRRDGSKNWYATVFQGSTISSQPLGTWNPAVANWQNILSFDLTGSGGTDLVAQDAATGEWWASMFNGTTYANVYLGAWDPSVSWQNLTVANFVGSGNALVARNSTTGDWWGIWFDGTSYHNQVIANWSPVGSFSHIATANLNGDGRTEIVGMDNGGNWWALMYNGTTFVNQFIGGWAPGVNWQFVTVADIQGNGKDSIVGWNPSNGWWWALTATGTGYASQVFGGWNPAMTYSHVMMGDFLGNGKTDIIAMDNTGAWWVKEYGLPNLFVGSFSTKVSWQYVMLADLTGNGRDDIVAWNPSTGVWWDIRSTPTWPLEEQLGTWSPTLTYSHVLTGDFFGDGRSDIIGMDSNGAWWVLEHGQGSISPGSWDPGIAWQNLAVGDIDGSGRDAIVARDPTTNNWWAIGYNGAGYTDQIITSWTSGITYQGVSFGVVPGASDAELRALILRQLPDLLTTINADALAGASELMNWAANVTTWARSGQIDQLASQLAPGQTAAEYYYNVFLPQRAGVFCWGTSAFYSHVLNLFGYNSFLMNFGDPGATVTHVIVIVPQWDGTQWHYYYFDPTFNATFHDATTGSYMDIFAMMDAVDSNNVSQIATVSGALASRIWLNTVAETSVNLQFQGINAFGYYTYTYPSYGIGQFYQDESSAFSALGISQGLAGLVQLMQQKVFSVGNSPDSVVAQQFIAQLQARGILVA
jgi:hypothetical protein